MLQAPNMKRRYQNLRVRGRGLSRCPGKWAGGRRRNGERLPRVVEG